MEHQEQQPPQHRQGHPKEGMQNPNSHEAVSLGLPFLFRCIAKEVRFRVRGTWKTAFFDHRTFQVPGIRKQASLFRAYVSLSGSAWIRLSSHSSQEFYKKLMPAGQLQEVKQSQTRL